MSFSFLDSHIYLDDKIKVARLTEEYLRKAKRPIILLTARYMKYGLDMSNKKYIVDISIEQLEKTLSDKGIKITSFQTIKGTSYYMAIISTNCRYASILKKITIGIEKRHKIGFLMDLNVVDVDGISLSRKVCAIEPRKCIICGGSDSDCLKNKHHEDFEYLNNINEAILNDKFSNQIVTQ